MKTVPLGGKKAAGRVALVDDEDYELVMQYRWHLWECEEKNQGPYVHAGIGGRTVSMHKLITGYARTDHANGNGLDNRRANLRESTGAQNAANRHMHVTNRSGFKGVRWRSSTPSSPWAARIAANGKEHHLGYFATPEDAARAYDAAAIRLHGEFARLNFPPAEHAGDEFAPPAASWHPWASRQKAAARASIPSQSTRPSSANMDASAPVPGLPPGVWEGVSMRFPLPR